MKIYILILTLSWIYSMSYAQLITIYDNDGYTNVRKKPSIESTIIGKVIEGQVLSISPNDDENGNLGWSNVWFQEKQLDKHLHYLKSERVTASGYIHKSRITYLSELPEVKPVHANANKIIFKDEQSAITFEVRPAQQLNEGYADLYFITIKNSSGTYNLPMEAMAGLRDIHIEQVKVYRGKKKEKFITATGADGSDSYEVAWCLKNNKLFSMTVMQTIP